MRKKTSIFRKYVLYSALVMVLSCAAVVVVLTMHKYKNTSMQFVDDGYMLIAANKEDGSNAINQQCYFSAGSNYRMSYGKAVVFTDASGNKISAETENFLHYNNGSMNALSQSVIFDTDNVQPGDQLSYYSISSESLLRKAGDGYSVNNNGGSPLELNNFLWKIANDRYMVVSKNIDLVVSENSEQSFSDYVELRYIDEGIAHIVTQSGTYSTISSDAYLLLDNGVRIYIGSKNVSDGENILMNMSSMVVGSDDNIDVIPDEDYTIESDKQPQIIVNANDGESGKAGESGTEGESGEAGEAGDNGVNGQNGANGRPGETGVDGDQGAQGESAPNSGIIYETKTVPIFNPVELDPSSYGVEANIKFDSNQCTVHEAWVSIVEVKTGNLIWKRYLRSENNTSTDILTPAMTLKCDTLSQNTEYTFAIYAKYTSPDASSVTQQLHSQLFKTDSLGININRKYATKDSVVIDIDREVTSLANRVRVKLYDNNLNLIGYASLQDDNGQYEYNYQDNSFNIRNLEAGVKLPLTFDRTLTGDPLSYNTQYYAQVEVMSLIDDSPVSIIPTSTFELLNICTLKRDPNLTAPKATLSESTNSFAIAPGQIQDFDNGAVSYRYEILDLTTNQIAYTEYLDTAKSIDVKLIGENVSGFLERNKPYKAQLVMMFDNNESVVEFRSPYSETFQAGQSSWPTVVVSKDNDYVTPTTIEGKIVISDPNNTIPLGNGNTPANITIKYTARIESISEQIEELIKTVTVNTSEVVYNSEEKTFTIPFSLKGLKSAQEYTLWVTSSEIITSSTTYTDALIGTVNISTSEYRPLLVEGFSNPDDALHSFSVNVVFGSSNLNKENQLVNKGSTIWGEAANAGLGLSNISGRSMTAIRFEIYDSKLVDGNYLPDESKKLAVYQVNADEFSSFTSTELVNERYTYTTGSSLYEKSYFNFVDSNGDNLINNLDIVSYQNAITQMMRDPEYLALSDEQEKNTWINNHLYGYLNQYMIVLTEENFITQNGINVVDEIGNEQNHSFFIKPVILDYTFGVGNSPLYGLKENEIGVGTNSNFVSGSRDDCWIEVNTSYVIPRIPEPPHYSQEDIVTVVEANQNITNGKYNNLNTNAKVTETTNNISELQSLWNTKGISANTTGVGIEYTGPRELASYCSSSVNSVKYDIYKKLSDGSLVLFDTSDWLDYDYNAETNNTMPSYTFFLDVKGSQSGCTDMVISRGEQFVIKTEIKLNGKETDSSGNPLVYPKDFITNGEIVDTIIIEKETPQIKLFAYDGKAGANEDVIYYQEKDPDNALTRYDDGNIKFFNSVSNALISATYDTANTISGLNGFKSAKLDITSGTENVQVQYVKAEGGTAGKIDLISESNLINISEKKIEIVPNTTQIGYDNQRLTINFNYKVNGGIQDPNKTALLGVELEFQGTNGIIKPYGPVILPSSSISENQNGNEYTYTATVSLLANEIFEVIGGEIKIKIKALYDTGLYGAKYLDSSATINPIDNPVFPPTIDPYSVRQIVNTGYYLVEFRKHDMSSNPVYPSEYYSHIQTGTNSQYLFSRNSFILEKDSTYNQLNLYHMVDEQKIIDRTYSFDKNGLYIEDAGVRNDIEIKNVGASVIFASTADIASALPTSYLDVVEGFSNAYVNISFASGHSLAVDQGLKVYYKNTETGNQYFKDIDISSGTSWDVTLDNLQNNKTYLIWLEGYIVDSSDPSGYRKQYVPVTYLKNGLTDTENNPSHTFTTLTMYEHVPSIENPGVEQDLPLYDTVNILPYNPSTPDEINRSSKYFIYYLNIPDVVLDDFKNSIDEIRIELKNTENSNDATIQTVNLNNTYIENIDNYFSLNPGSTVKGTITYPVIFAWEPSATTLNPTNYKVHQMGDDSKIEYTVKTTYIYKEINGYRQDDIPGNNIYNIGTWDIRDSKFTIPAKKITTVNENQSVSYGLEFSFAGTDMNRLFPVDSNGKFTVLAELKYAQSGTGVIAGDPAIDIVTHEKIQVKIEASVDSDGNVVFGNNGKLQINNLYPNTFYYLELHTVIDKHNVDRKVLDKTKNWNELISLCNFSTRSYSISTDAADDIIIAGISLNATTKEHTVIGTNLNKVKKITYTYTIANEQSRDVTIVNNIISAFKPDSQITDVYYLSIPEIDPSKDFQVRVNFFKTTTGTTPDTFIEGAYVAPQSN